MLFGSIVVTAWQRCVVFDTGPELQHDFGPQIEVPEIVGGRLQDVINGLKPTGSDVARERGVTYETTSTAVQDRALLDFLNGESFKNASLTSREAIGHCVCTATATTAR